MPTQVLLEATHQSVVFALPRVALAEAVQPLIVSGSPGLGGTAGTGDVTTTGAPGFGLTAQTSMSWSRQDRWFKRVWRRRLLASYGTLVNGYPASGYGGGGGGGTSYNGSGTTKGGDGSSGLVIITEYGMTALSGTATGAVRYDLPQGLTSTQMAQGRANIAAPLRGWIAGLTLSTAGSSATFGIAAG